jgi:hypothetical protein
MKQLLLLLCLATVGFTSAQTDTTSSGDYFLTFVKKVYLNPTVYLRCQDFKETTNIGFVALPDLSSSQNNASSGFEKGLQKLLRLLMQTDGGIRFYFNPDTPTAPFTFWHSENLWCKFKQPEKDSITYYLNHNFSDGNLDLNNNQRFESTIDETLDYIQRVLAGNTAECGSEPQNETTTINTKPLSISLHNRSNSQYDIDSKQYEKLESFYAKAFDEHTQQEWYAPSKLLVPNETDEPVALAIHSNESNFRKQNIRIEVLKTHAVLAIDPSSTADSIFFKIPKTLPHSDPVEILVKYKSTVDSIMYTVGFFMVHTIERKTHNLVLIPANDFVISTNLKDSVQQELDKIYGRAGVDFNVTVENSIVFPDEYPTSIEMENSGLLSNYPFDLQSYVADVKYFDDYEPDNYYLVVGLSSTELQGYMPRARNIGFIFSNAVSKPKVIAHEIGHGVFHFRHIFSDEELGAASQGTTSNIMDYVSSPRDLYLHQWNFIQDPAFVTWSDGDDEDAAITTCNIAMLEPFKVNNRFHFIKNNGKYISLPATIQSVSFSTMDRYIYSETGFQSDYVAPVGALLIFTDGDGNTFRNMGDGYFYDNNNVKYTEDLSLYDSIHYAITCFIDVDPTTKELFPVFFQAPSNSNVASTQNPRGIDTEQSLVIFKNNLSISFFIQSPLDYMTYARNGLNSLNPNFIRGGSVDFTSDGIPFKFYRSTDTLLFGPPQPPQLTEITFDEFRIDHLFPSYLTNRVYTNEEILKYLTIKSIRKSELSAIAHCIESETIEDSKVNLKSLELMTIACTTCMTDRAKLQDLRSRTIYSMISQAFSESSNVTSTLEDMVLQNKTALELGEYISHEAVCDMYGIPWETRSKVLNKIVYDDASWNVNGKSILAMLINSSVDDDGKKMLDFFKESSYGRLSAIISQIDEWTDWSDASDVKDGMSATESLIRHVILNKASFPQSTDYFTFSVPQPPTQAVTLQNSSGILPPVILNFPNKTYTFEFPVVELPIVLGAVSGTAVELPKMSFGSSNYGSSGGYELKTKTNQTKYPITWDPSTGTFKVIQNYTVSEKLTGLVYATAGSSFPDIEIYSINFSTGYTLQPYDLVDVIIGDNYGALDLPKGTVLQLPVITAFFLQESIREENFSQNFRLVFDLVEIGAAIVAIVTAPVTLGSSLVIFAGVMASIDVGIQEQRNNTATAQEYYSSSYQAWDDIKMISDFALGVHSIYKLGQYALKQGRSFVLAIAIRRAVKNTQLPSDFASMSPTSKNLTKRIIVAVQKGVYLENTYYYVSSTGKLVNEVNLGTFVKKIGDYDVFAEGEVFYRGMSKADYEYLLANGKIRAPLNSPMSEVFTSPSLEYIKSVGYGGDGVIVKFKMKPGTLDEMVTHGVRDQSNRAAALFPEMESTNISGWENNGKVYFKQETIKGTTTKQVNIGLGKNENGGLLYFNGVNGSNILEFQIVY